MGPGGPIKGFRGETLADPGTAGRDFRGSWSRTWITIACPEARRSYVVNVLRSVKPRGHVIVATFAEDGPTQCSGLPVMRYSPDELHAEFGASFSLLKQEREAHQTPSGGVQKFIYCYCRISVD